MPRVSLLLALLVLAASCGTPTAPSAQVRVPDLLRSSADIPSGFQFADGSRPLNFPADFGAHPNFRTEWWYYTGNLETPRGRHFGFELTIFRVGLLPSAVELPNDSAWYEHSIYFAHFALSDIVSERFYAFERYARPGPGLAGARADPYRIWIEDWSIAESAPSVYRLRAGQEEIAIDLTLVDEMGVVLHGANGYSRKGEQPANASYYYSQPRLRAEGIVLVDGANYSVNGLAWKDHEFSTSVLDKNQIGWDWFALQISDGSAVMLFQLRERDGGISEYSSGTYIFPDGTTQPLEKSDFAIHVSDDWRSPGTQGIYPSAWEIHLGKLACAWEVTPWMADQEIHFPAVTYWEGAVRINGTCGGKPARGNGYVELTGYAGNLPWR